MHRIIACYIPIAIVFMHKGMNQELEDDDMCNLQGLEVASKFNIRNTTPSYGP